MATYLEPLMKGLALLPKGLELLGEGYEKANNALKYDFRIAHAEYCTNVITKFGKAKTFFVREEPQYLDQFYVPASLLWRNDKERIERADIASLARIGRKVIIGGSGGSGKTVFMRHLLINAIERGAAYPVFLELRNINTTGVPDLEALICSFMSDHGFPLTDRLALKSLEEGLIIVLLDGFDEVASSKRKALESSIKRLASKYPCQIVLSSRPDMVLEGWDGFTTARIAPLDIEEAVELIEKIEFDGEVKARFIQKLQSGLFRTHKYFLSNPLLLSIMLLTYGDSADIPSKFASFYEQAYTALFQQHDALKSGYRRERLTTLDIYEFSRLFAAFSAISYSKRKLRFSVLEAIECVKQAQRITGIGGINPEDFLQDAKQAVCLLVDEGLELTFVHRSFQEYFVARFINAADDSVQKQYIRSLSTAENDPRMTIDNVLRLLYEMTPALVEENYLVPILKPLFTEPNRKLSLQRWRDVFVQIFSEINLHRDEEGVGYTVRSWKKLNALLFVNGISASTRNRAVDVGDIAQELELYFGDSDALKTKEIAGTSKMWPIVARSAGSFGLEEFDVIRAEYREMIRRSAERNSALQDIFDFGR